MTTRTDHRAEPSCGCPHINASEVPVMARQRPRPATPANTRSARILAGAALLVLTVGLTACEDPDGGGGGGYVAQHPISAGR